MGSLFKDMKEARVTAYVEKLADKRGLVSLVINARLGAGTKAHHTSLIRQIHSSLDRLEVDAYAKSATAAGEEKWSREKMDAEGNGLVLQDGASLAERNAGGAGIGFGPPWSEDSCPLLVLGFPNHRLVKVAIKFKDCEPLPTFYVHEEARDGDKFPPLYFMTTHKGPSGDAYKIRVTKEGGNFALKEVA